MGRYKLLKKRSSTKPVRLLYAQVCIFLKVFCQGIQKLGFQLSKKHKNCQKHHSKIGKWFLRSAFLCMTPTYQELLHQPEQNVVERWRRKNEKGKKWLRCNRKQSRLVECRNVCQLCSALGTCNQLCWPRPYNIAGSSFTRHGAQVSEVWV